MPQAKKARPNKQPVAKQPSNAEKRINQPLTPAALAEYGELKTPAPTDAFDPSGPWKQTWRIWMTGGSWDNYRGYLTLERSNPRPPRDCDLKILQALVLDRMRAVHETRVTLSNRANEAGVVQNWRLQSRIYDLKTKEEFKDAVVEQTGFVRGLSFEIATNGRQMNDRSLSRKASRHMISNWSLFEFVQIGIRGPVKFDLLEDLDTLKPGQQLVRREKETIQFGDVATLVTRYDQLGPGCLPCRYYVDGNGRLLLAHTPLRAYILDAKALEVHAKKIESLANKELK